MKLRKLWNEFATFIKLIKVDYPKIIYIILAGSLAGALQPFLHLIFYARVLDKIYAREFKESIKDIAILLISTLLLHLISKACTQSIKALREGCKDSIFLKTADKAYTMEYEEFEKMETMDAIRRVRSGEDGAGGIEDQIQSLYDLTEKGFSILFSLVFVVNLFMKVEIGNRNFFTSIWSTVLIVVIFILVLLGSKKLSDKPFKELYVLRKKNEHFNSIGIYMLSIMHNYQYGKDIRIFSMQGLLENYYKKITKQVNKVFLNWGISTGRYMAVIMILTQLMSGLVYIIIGSKAIYGVISVGSVFMYVGAVLQLTESIKYELTEYNNFHYRAEYLNTYYDFINRPSTHYVGTLPIEKRSDAEYEFTLENVSFAYPGTEEEILKDINLTFKIGEKYAIVGRNGAGKTTLIKLLCRLYDPTKGRILLNGIDIKYYDYAEYVKIFSVVFQDFKLLSLPLADNVSAGDEVEEERIWEVLKNAGLKERVIEMPDGIWTQLYKNNGNGIEISGGEAQKLAIARALYKDGPFVILDEPTAALDPISEAEIYENFNSMIHGKTAIYISHRMSSCKFCDDIIVLDGGRIAERGNHEKLISENGIYAALYNAQAQYYTK